MDICRTHSPTRTLAFMLSLTLTVSPGSPYSLSYSLPYANPHLTFMLTLTFAFNFTVTVEHLNPHSVHASHLNKLFRTYLLPSPSHLSPLDLSGKCGGVMDILLCEFTRERSGRVESTKHPCVFGGAVAYETPREFGHERWVCTG